MNEIGHCIVDQKPFEINEGVFLSDLESLTRNLIKKDYPDAKNESFICSHHLLKYQLLRVDRLINSDQKQTDKINRRLTKALKNMDYDVVDVNSIVNKHLTIGQKVSDNIARFGGSWTFIFIFIGVLLTWMIINGFALFGAHFDRFPFILLNLVLSCISAIQAPIIMMSQNRSADRDRLDSENAYHVNLKSENELRILHAKLDNLMQNQLPHSLEIQKIEIEILGNLQKELTDLQNKFEEYNN